MKNVLVTGCSGYIGSHLVKMLKDDYNVYGLDIKYPSYKLDNFYYMNLHGKAPLDFDLEDVSFDTIIHLAALVKVGESERIPGQYYSTNLIGTSKVLPNNIPTSNFIFASTGAAEFCQSPYAISKRAAEDIVKEQCNNHNIPYTIFRFYNVIGTDGFGPTNPDGLMLRLIEAGYTGKFTIFGNDYDTKDGTAVRDYVHVNEICLAIKEAIEKPANGLECLGHGIGHTVKEMAETFRRVNNVKFDIEYGPRRPGDVPVSVLSKVSPYMKNLYGLDELLKVDP